MFPSRLNHGMSIPNPLPPSECNSSKNSASPGTWDTGSLGHWLLDTLQSFSSLQNWVGIELFSFLYLQQKCKKICKAWFKTLTNFLTVFMAMELQDFCSVTLSTFWINNSKLIWREQCNSEKKTKVLCGFFIPPFIHNGTLSLHLLPWQFCISNALGLPSSSTDGHDEADSGINLGNFLMTCSPWKLRAPWQKGLWLSVHCASSTHNAWQLNVE